MQLPGPSLILGRGNPFQLLVALSPLGRAQGNLYWDDGYSLGMLSNPYSMFDFNQPCFVLRFGYR